MSKPRLLDLYCSAGGASMGFHRAGFEVVGIDIDPQPNYPFEFIRADALEPPVFWDDFVAIHASPPCQAYSTATGQSRKRGEREYVDLIPATRRLLEATGLPYVIENVVGSPLINPARLCGTTFNLPLRRHRLFETNWPLSAPGCRHERFTEPKYWTGWRPNGEHRLSTVVQVYGNGGDAHEWAEAMQIDWMSKAELAQAIPPAYCELVGKQLLKHLSTRTEALDRADPAVHQEVATCRNSPILASPASTRPGSSC